MTTKPDPRISKAQALTQATVQKYGHLSAVTGETGYKINTISTGSLLWDYMTGIGGHPMGNYFEVFGANTIGKTTIVGAGALCSAQAQGMLTGTIAVEPDVDEMWLAKHGVNPDYNVIARPDNGEEAFELLHDWIASGAVDFILFDSIGAISSQKEQDSDKPQAYGNSALISWGIKRDVVQAWKKNIGVMFLNQVRDDTKAKIAGLVDSPGGHTFKHTMRMRTHIKPGKGRYTVKMSDGHENKDVLVGRQLVVSFKKNKAAQALGRSARFDFYHIESDKYPFGFDVTTDVLAAAKVSGVFEGSGWIKHRTFPGGKINGKEKLGEFIADHPEVLPIIRDDVIKVMLETAAKKKKEPKPTLKAVEG